MSKKGPISYEEAKRLAVHDDPAVRRELASRPDVMPEILFYLVADPSPEVREALAENRAVPHLADLRLAEDADDAVRSKLAVKIVEFLPELTSAEARELEHLAYRALDMLARDQVTRVRQVIAETLKDVAHAPPDVINRLARDAEIVVAGPILQDSAVLTDADLLEILSEGPVQGALSAIARRHRVGGEVADAVARTGDVEAVGCLLSNPHAQIREDTLDWIIDRARDVGEWHEPLVERPSLPGAAARRIARHVADNLLETLASRGDLAPEVAETLRKEVQRRLDPAEPEPPIPPKKGKPRAEASSPLDPVWKRILLDARSVQDAAVTLLRSGQLEGPTVLDALAQGYDSFAVAALSVMAGVPYEVGERIVAMRSPKGMAALAGRAAVPGDMLAQLQVRLCRVSPEEVLRGPEPDRCPLSDDEITWQLEFFTHLVTTEQ